MNRLVAEQKSETPKETLIQRTYLSDGKYKTISEIWTPKLSWFRPPCVKLFKWAYNVRIDMSDRVKTMITDVTEFRDISGVTQIGMIINNGGDREC